MAAVRFDGDLHVSARIRRDILRRSVAAVEADGVVVGVIHPQIIGFAGVIRSDIVKAVHLQVIRLAGIRRKGDFQRAVGAVLLGLRRIGDVGDAHFRAELREVGCAERLVVGGELVVFKVAEDEVGEVQAVALRPFLHVFADLRHIEREFLHVVQFIHRRGTGKFDAVDGEIDHPVRPRICGEAEMVDVDARASPCS